MKLLLHPDGIHERFNYIMMQASVLRSAKEVRVVEKNQELA